MPAPTIEDPNVPPELYYTLGMFHGMGNTRDAVVDYALGAFLKTSPEDTHILTAGMEFGKKSRLLIELIKRSDHKKKATLISSLSKIQAAQRDQIAHSYLKTGKSTL